MHHVGGDEVSELCRVVWRKIGSDVLVDVFRRPQLVLFSEGEESMDVRQAALLELDYVDPRDDSAEYLCKALISTELDMFVTDNIPSFRTSFIIFLNLR